MVVNYVGNSPTAIFFNAKLGMRSGENQVAQASHEIARMPLYKQESRQRSDASTHSNQSNPVVTDNTGYTPSPLVRELINLNEGELSFLASARSMEAAHVMFSTLLGHRQTGEQGADVEYSR